MRVQVVATAEVVHLINYDIKTEGKIHRNDGENLEAACLHSQYNACGGEVELVKYIRCFQCDSDRLPNITSIKSEVLEPRIIRKSQVFTSRRPEISRDAQRLRQNELKRPKTHTHAPQFRFMRFMPHGGPSLLSQDKSTKLREKERQSLVNLLGQDPSSQHPRIPIKLAS